LTRIPLQMASAAWMHAIIMIIGALLLLLLRDRRRSLVPGLLNGRNLFGICIWQHKVTLRSREWVLRFHGAPVTTTLEVEANEVQTTNVEECMMLKRSHRRLITHSQC
jgi:hypothetical protein